MQALPLIESGAADAFGLSDRELALACASHRAEAAHVAAVEALAWGVRFGGGGARVWRARAVQPGGSGGAGAA